MGQFLGQISLLVKDYDEAIEYYSYVLEFDLIEDTRLSETKRWVVMQPKGSSHGCRLLLAKASSSEQIKCIGNQTGGRVFLFLYTDDIMRDFDAYRNKGVEFIRPVQEESYGKVTVFKDLYGNLWDLIEENK